MHIGRNLNMEKMSGTSMNIELENIKKLKELFPNAVTEGKIDFDVLRTMLGDEINDSKEKFQFIWTGKGESIKLAQSPSSATLRPWNRCMKWCGPTAVPSSTCFAIPKHRATPGWCSYRTPALLSS